MRQISRLTALAVTIAGVGLMAQESVGTVTGTVTSKGGAPVANASLHITSPVLLGGRKLTAEPNGAFRIPLLPPGEYALTASKDGFVSSKATFRVIAGQIVRQEFVLRAVETASTVVEVVAVSAQVDKTETRTATVVSAAQLSTLPTSLTTQAAMFLSPGVSGTDDRPSFRGGVQGSAQFYVNGISVRDGNQRYGRQTAYVIEDLTEDIQVVLSPLNAKFGNTSSGLTNLTTKQGTNDFQGSLRVNLVRDAWTTVSAPDRVRRFGTTKSAGSSLNSDDLQKSYSMTLLGPIIPNKLTFSFGMNWAPGSMGTVTFPNQLNADRASYTSVLTGTTGAATPGFTFGQVDPLVPRQILRDNGQDIVQNAKLFWMISEGHQLEVNISYDKYGPGLDVTSSGTGAGDKLDPDLTMAQKSVRQMRGINYRGIFGNGVLDFQIGQTKKAINFSAGPLDPVGVRFWSKDAKSIANNYSLSTMYTTEGDTSSAAQNIRNNNQVKLNYQLMADKHNMDMGYERFQEVYGTDNGWGPNSRAFFTPGLSAAPGNANGRAYQVYNFYASPFNNASYSLFNTLVMSGAGYVPEMRLWKSSGGTESRAIDTVDSVYFNDLYTVNSHWSVMGGLRLDRWKGSARMGQIYSNSGFSPRTEVKYDLDGNNRHVFSASFAFLRGTTGNGVLRGTYGQNGLGNETWRYFWNAGTADPYFVNRAEFQNPANYRLFMVSNNDVGRHVISNLRPEVTKQVELGYRRAFERGGDFRLTAVFTRVYDNLKRVGFDEVETGVDPSGGQAAYTNSNIKSLVTFDPDNVRKGFTLEMAWNLPLFKGANSSVDFNGFYTVTRSRGRVTFW